MNERNTNRGRTKRRRALRLTLGSPTNDDNEVAARGRRVNERRGVINCTAALPSVTRRMDGVHQRQVDIISTDAERRLRRHAGVTSGPHSLSSQYTRRV